MRVAQEEEFTGDAVPMPELQHNLRLLVDLAEADIRKIDARLRHAQDTAVLLGREQARRSQTLLPPCGWRARHSHPGKHAKGMSMIDCPVRGLWTHAQSVAGQPLRLGR